MRKVNDDLGGDPAALSEIALLYEGCSAIATKVDLPAQRVNRVQPCSTRVVLLILCSLCPKQVDKTSRRHLPPAWIRGASSRQACGTSAVISPLARSDAGGSCGRELRCNMRHRALKTLTYFQLLYTP